MSDARFELMQERSHTTGKWAVASDTVARLLTLAGVAFGRGEDVRAETLRSLARDYEKQRDDYAAVLALLNARIENADRTRTKARAKS